MGRHQLVGGAPPAAHSPALSRRRLRLAGLAVDVRSTEPRPGRPIVMVHGIGVSGAYFIPFAGVLAARHPVHLLDLPGYGSTPKPPRALTVPELAEVAGRAVLALGLDRPVLIGQSMGCQVVGDALAARPGLAAGYVLIGPTLDSTARSLPRQALRLARDVTRETAANNLLVIRDYARMGLPRFLRTTRSMLADRIEDSLATIASPGLIVRGERDPIAPRRWVRHLAGLAPDAGWAEIPGAAHNAQHTHPDALADACAPFLASLPAT